MGNEVGVNSQAEHGILIGSSQSIRASIATTSCARFPRTGAARVEVVGQSGTGADRDQDLPNGCRRLDVSRPSTTKPSS